MSSKKVSILLPNLNNRQFLDERFQSILNQTFSDWECIILDSYSDDGAWGLIQEYAKKDQRIKISQIKREGIYPAINKCIEKANGEYIYIATSDDTMTPDCLGKMTQALDDHPECDICHCCLTIIDQNSNAHKDLNWNDFYAQKYLGHLIYKKHIRLAPYDAILYSCLGTVYSSLTQLLIRRSVIEKIGNFSNKWESYGDFEWGMKASLVCNIIHIPEYLATFRKHENQATPQNINLVDNRKKKIEMINNAYKFWTNNITRENYKFTLKDLTDMYNFEIFVNNLRNKNFLEVILCPRFLYYYIKNILIRNLNLNSNFLYNNINRTNKLIEKNKLDKNIRIL